MSKEEKKESAIQRTLGELVSKIEQLTGKQKQEFCASLSESEKKAYIKYLRDRDMEEVECVFRCHEPLGGSVTLTAIPYKGCELNQTFVDGQTYKIPLYLAKRMNNEWQGCGTWYPTHAHVLDAQGKPIVNVAKKNHRFGCTSTALV